MKFIGRLSIGFWLSCLAACGENPFYFGDNAVLSQDPAPEADSPADSTDPTPEPTPMLSLNAVGKIYQGFAYSFSGSCAPDGSRVDLALTNALPATIPDCACSGGTYACPSTTLSSVTAASVSINASNAAGANAARTEPAYVPSVSLDFPGYFSGGDTVTFRGSCYPDELSVDISLPSANPSAVSGCTCSGGAYSCPATSIVSVPTPKVVVQASNGPGSSGSQTVFTSRTAYAVAGTIPGSFGCNMVMPLNLPGDASLPSDQVAIHSTGTCQFGNWNPPGNAVGSFELLGFSFLTSDIFADNSPPYLDIVGTIDRVLTLDFGASPASLDDADSRYYFWIAMAGLGVHPENVTITSNRSLQVIGYQDSFGTGHYSYLDGSATSVGSTGTVISTRPNSAGDGYTFFLLQDRSVSTLQLSYVAGATPDPHGFILGAIEVRNE